MCPGIKLGWQSGLGEVRWCRDNHMAHKKHSIGLLNIKGQKRKMCPSVHHSFSVRFWDILSWNPRAGEDPLRGTPSFTRKDMNPKRGGLIWLSGSTCGGWFPRPWPRVFAPCCLCPNQRGFFLYQISFFPIPTFSLNLALYYLSSF